jgi:hypothetical protein
LRHDVGAQPGHRNRSIGLELEPSTDLEREFKELNKYDLEAPGVMLMYR